MQCYEFVKQPLYQQLFLSLRPQIERLVSKDTVERRIRQSAVKMKTHLVQYQHSNDFHQAVVEKTFARLPSQIKQLAAAFYFLNVRKPIIVQSDKTELKFFSPHCQTSLEPKNTI